MSGKGLTISAREPLKDGEFLTGYNSKFTVGGEELTGITKADVRFRPDELVMATLEIYVVPELDGVVIEETNMAKLAANIRELSVASKHKLHKIAVKWFDELHRDRWNRAVDCAYFALKSG